jgi:GH24 family phage-related lysozyme (muramidase)
MENRFLEMDDYLKSSARGSSTMSKRPLVLGRSTSLSLRWTQPFSAADRVLVILIENGGIDLGIPALVDQLIQLFPGSSALPDSVRQLITATLRDKLKSFTDNLIETAELAANRYTAGKPSLFSDVVVLRDGTASYDDLKSKLIALSKDNKIVDLFILTHGTGDLISVTGGIDGAKIRAMKTENGKPLSLRSVYMMNCVGSSLNQAWLDAGAKTSCGTLGNNYLPEPTMFFFWQNWKDGQSFESAATSAYRKTINLMTSVVQALIDQLPFPFNKLADLPDFESMDFVKSSAPQIVGQRTVTVNTDDLTFTQTLSSGLVTTVLPLSLLRSLSEPDGGVPAASGPTGLSTAGVQLIKSFEGFIPKLYNDPAGHCTVGYGTLVHKYNCDGRSSEDPYKGGIPEDQATQLLNDEANKTATMILKTVKVSLNQNQLDALTSFVYNVGEGAFKDSTLLKVLNKGDYGTVPSEMKRWTKATVDGKKVDLPGLVKRRDAEADLFQKPAGSTSQSLSVRSMSMNRAPQHSFLYRSPSMVMQQSNYSRMQNPAAVVAGIEIADAIQIGLGGVAIAQAGVSSVQGSFALTYDKAQRLLTNEARAQMPGSQSTKQSYSRRLFFMGIERLNAASAEVIIEWEGNPFGEIGTPVIRRNLKNSTEWSKSSANITITKLDRIPLPKTEPRTWPIVYSYEGSYDPWGNGYWEFSGEFEVNAFGGLKFNRHEVVSRSLIDAPLDKPEDYVQKGADAIVPVPEIPKEQLDYLRAKLP